MLLDWNRWGRLALTVGFAVLGGWCALYVHVPLPWVLGPMVAVACVSMANQVYKQPVLARKSAQIYIGASIGFVFHACSFTTHWRLGTLDGVGCVCGHFHVGDVGPCFAKTGQRRWPNSHLFSGIGRIF